MKSDAFAAALDRATSDALVVGPINDEAQLKYPLLWQWLTSCEAGRDHLKVPAKLSIKASGAAFLCSLSDEAYGVSLDASSDSLDGCFAALESALSQPQPAIRTWPNHTPRLRKRKKG